MGNYLRNFKEVAQYESYISGSPILPNVSKIDEDSSVKYTSLMVTSITINSFSYNPSNVEYTGGIATPVVSYKINYNNGTSKTTGGIVSYVKNSGNATMDGNGVLTWTANTTFNELTTNVTVTVVKDGIQGTLTTNSKQNAMPVLVTSVTVNSFTYSPSSVKYFGGTSTPTVTYTIEYNDGHTETTGGTISYSKNSGDATINTSNGTATWEENSITGELTTNVTVTVTKDSVNGTLTADSKQDAMVFVDHKLGDICYWDETNEDICYIPYSAWTSDLGTPLAVCVVPSTHTASWYGIQSKAKFMSIYGVTTGGSSSSTEVNMYWSSFGNFPDAGLMKYNCVPIWNNTNPISVTSSTEGFLSSDSFTGTTNAIDTKSKYDNTILTKMIPSPYSASEEFNTYYSTNNFYEAGKFNILSDFNGENNTLRMVSYNCQSAKACNSYSNGVLKSGKWYLPAAGELGYIILRLNVINAALNKVNGVALSNNEGYWSSTECSKTDEEIEHIYDFAIKISKLGGGVYMSNKGYINVPVRPFVSLP